MKFKDLGLSKNLLTSIEKIGFKETTPIQSATIPLALLGRDIIGQAQTGTGKTAAFGIPMLEKVDPYKRKLQGLVIAPTRELAIQTKEELYKLGRNKTIRVQVIYGGSDIKNQIIQLKMIPHILVGTPGRMLDLINRKILKLSNIETLVLDEADEMLNMGFLEDIKTIISKIPKERQSLLFSATMPSLIKDISMKFLKNPQHIHIKSKEMTSDSIDQYYIRSNEKEKFNLMTRLLDIQEPELTIIFGRTKRRVDELAYNLGLLGYKAEGIHGDLSQSKRTQILRSFKNKKLEILVATDVAARGLDISGVSHVYNYDIPQDPESYIHRIGRTGRAGNIGISLTFVTMSEMGYLRTIEKLTKKRMKLISPPTPKEALKKRLDIAMEKINQKISEGNLTAYLPIVDKLLTNHSPENLVALLLKTFSRKSANSSVTITLDSQLPPKKKNKSIKSSFSIRKNFFRKSYQNKNIRSLN